MCKCEGRNMGERRTRGDRVKGEGEEREGGEGERMYAI